MSSQADFLKAVRGLPFEAHNIGHELDATGRYALKFDGDFPLRIRLFEYRSGRFTRGVTWHEKLELFFLSSDFEFLVPYFTQVAGMSYLEYITHLRLTAAARLLRGRSGLSKKLIEIF